MVVLVSCSPPWVQSRGGGFAVTALLNGEKKMLPRGGLESGFAPFLAPEKGRIVSCSGTQEGGDTAQGIPRRSLGPVLILPNQAQVANSDGIACCPGGMTVSQSHA